MLASLQLPSLHPPRQQQQQQQQSSAARLAPCQPFGRRSQHKHSSRLPPPQGRRVVDPIIPPVIITGPEGGEEAVDLYNHLLRNRIVFIGSRITDVVATQVIASLLALDSLGDEDIRLYINTQAGSPYSVVAILDTIRSLKCPVATVGFGMVGGAAALVLAAGAKGKRFCMPNTRIMLQQPNGGAMGSADEVNIQATELNRTMKVCYRFMSEFTGLPVEQVEEECDRENFLAPQQAVELGLIDGVIGQQ